MLSAFSLLAPILITLIINFLLQLLGRPCVDKPPKWHVPRGVTREGHEGHAHPPKNFDFGF